MPRLLEPAVPAAEEDDGGDGAQQKQQEEEGTLDAIGSQQDEERGGDHGAGAARPAGFFPLQASLRSEFTSLRYVRWTMAPDSRIKEHILLHSHGGKCFNH